MKAVFPIAAVSSLLALAACSRGSEQPPVPENAPTGWQMKSIDKMGGRGDCLQRWRVEYGGPGIAHVDVCSVPSEAVALDLQQNWKARANTVTFFTKRYFVTMNWDAGEREALTALTTKLEKTLKVD